MKVIFIAMDHIDTYGIKGLVYEVVVPIVGIIGIIPCIKFAAPLTEKALSPLCRAITQMESMAESKEARQEELNMAYNKKMATCEIKNIEEFKIWLEEEGYRREDIHYASPVCDGGWFNDNWRSYFYGKQGIFSGTEVTNIFNDCVKDTYRSRTRELFDLLSYLEAAGQKMEVFYTDETATLAGFGKKRFVLPTKWLLINYPKDYSNLTLSQLKAIGGPIQETSFTEVALSGEISQNSLEEKKKMQEEKINDLQRQIKDVEDAKEGELAKLREEIEKKMAYLESKKKEMLQSLQEKMAEMEEKKAEMEKQIFMLETQIYGIRCYLGEVVNFLQITSGKAALEEEEVVIYQKIRFLDEEMGKALAIYNFDGNDTDLFIDVLRKREDIRELFAPGNKSISFLRVSNSATQIGMHERIRNMLQKYETYHGRQLAILIRNGENTHIAWLDEEKISIDDGNVFMAPSTRVSGVDEELPRQSSKTEMISRYFILSLLRGIRDNSKLIHIENDKITFSYADGWLDNKKYGDFSDIIERVSALPLTKGEIVLTSMHITRDDDYRTRDDRYNNNRGIGAKNRTHDASLKSLTVYPLNKVLRDITYILSYRDHKTTLETEKIPSEYITGAYSIRNKNIEITDEIIKEGTISFTLEEEEREYYESRYGVDFSSPTKNMDNILKTYDKMYGLSGKNTNYDTATKSYYCREYYDISYKETEYHYYLSAIKSDSRWNTSGVSSRANMEVYTDEIIPLTYLNTTWVKYAITTKHIGRWRIGGTTLTYAESLLYLNHLLAFLSKREEEECRLLTEAGLREWIEENADWPVMLSEWKIENKVRSMTDYQAKRFAKYIKTRGTER